MRLATLREGGRDGTLAVISSDGERFFRAPGVAATLQEALDDWDRIEPLLRQLQVALDGNSDAGECVQPELLHAPLPRAYEWVDGSAYVNHVVLVRKARQAEPPATLHTDPLVYQGGSGVFLGPQQPIPLTDRSWGLDFESEICVVLGDTPQGTTKAEALDHVKLILLCNDVTLRNLVPAELAKSFGFFQSKPATAFSPFALTPDELGPAWQDGRVHLNLKTRLNGQLVGDVAAGPEMHFGFDALIEHIARTRSFTAGTIVGSGTVSNEDTRHGSSCLSERRMLELISDGEAKTPWLQDGDRVQIEMFGPKGRNLFGTIDQVVEAA